MIQSTRICFKWITKASLLSH